MILRRRRNHLEEIVKLLNRSRCRDCLGTGLRPVNAAGGRPQHVHCRRCLGTGYER